MSFAIVPQTSILSWKVLPILPYGIFNLIFYSYNCPENFRIKIFSEYNTKHKQNAMVSHALSHLILKITTYEICTI